MIDAKRKALNGVPPEKAQKLLEEGLKRLLETAERLDAVAIVGRAADVAVGMVELGRDVGRRSDEAVRAELRIRPALHQARMQGVRPGPGLARYVVPPLL